jgi:hypothetical protein
MSNSKLAARQALSRVDELRAQLRAAEAELSSARLALQNETRTLILSEPVLRRLAA